MYAFLVCNFGSKSGDIRVGRLEGGAEFPGTQVIDFISAVCSFTRREPAL